MLSTQLCSMSAVQVTWCLFLTGVAKWPCHRDAYSARREVRALSSSSLAASVRGRRVLAKITVSSWLSHCILGLHCSRGLDDFGATPGSKVRGPFLEGTGSG